MVTKTIYRLLLACLALFLMVGCTKHATLPSSGNSSNNSSSNSSALADRVEVVYFHRTQRCYSCQYVEAGTRYTVETYFKDDLASGRVIFQVFNVEDKGNAAIVKKYGAFTSSLFINTIKDGSDHIKQATAVYSLIGKDDAFAKALKSMIEQSLRGEV